MSHRQSLRRLYTSGSSPSKRFTSTKTKDKTKTKTKTKTKSSNLSLPPSQPHKKSTPAQDFAKFQAHRWHDARKYNQIAKNVQTGEGALLQNTTQYNNDNANANANANANVVDAELGLQDASQPVITLIDLFIIKKIQISCISRGFA
ncbi:hypothetical protein PVL30_002609 [Lodderomyces elongisporus]|uniref:uncharacterized protein n=1 Tax=Lodderomyces elongisporus TaxID=36914 RepID=UPI0029219208|nr:uncharacterized protein PVL30_002609 [Lodderomyces elongisporus]WLF78864.1 hypothetical protein PVL30_002609 [Lodderomyces elongisporus]